MADVDYNVTPDFTQEMIAEAKRTGYITVYSKNSPLWPNFTY